MTREKPMRMKRGLWLVSGLLLLFGMQTSVWADGNGTSQLDAFFKDLNTLQAEFVQTLVDDSQQVRDESEGVLMLSRPGLFRLDYQRPYEQLYVADGEKVWMYDKDLEQVTVRPQDEALGSTPALLLSGTEPLDTSFILEDRGEEEGYTWIDLKPRAKDAGFAYFRIALEGGTLRVMEMMDSFGQLTRLYFHTVTRNPSLEPQTFVFTPPSGVDVIGE